MSFIKTSVEITIRTNNIAELMVALKRSILLFFTCGFILFSANATATQANTTTNNSVQLAQLKVTPKPCVSLRKGQKCYLEVTFNWLHPKVNNYCLVNITTNKLVKCWQQQAEGEFSFDFQSTLSNEFVLRQQGSTTDLARTQIPVAWVYKSSKRAKSTWRIF